MNRTVVGQVDLPGSKSESNRALMIAAYGGFPLEPVGLSDAHDTVLLQQCLRQVAKADVNVCNVVDCEDAGTVARFLLTYLACREGEWVLTGSDRLCHRPMKALVDALMKLGADITYQQQEGCLPLRLRGRHLTGGSVVVDASQSSQFVSSLLLAAPVWRDGLCVRLVSSMSSEPYIKMTMAMMNHFGASVAQTGDTITVHAKPYQAKPFTVARDWSSASYWYELASLSNRCDLLLKGLQNDALQGDRKAAEMFSVFGVKTSFEPEGVRLTKEVKNDASSDKPLFFDITDTPDLFPALMVTCVALHNLAVINGIQNLKFKESDRVDAIISELVKLYSFDNVLNKNYVVVGKSTPILINTYINTTTIKTYSDHRIAMAFAPLSYIIPDISIEQPEVVRKSYPTFWNEIDQLQIC